MVGSEFNYVQFVHNPSPEIRPGLLLKMVACWHCYYVSITQGDPGSLIQSAFLNNPISCYRSFTERKINSMNLFAVRVVKTIHLHLDGKHLWSYSVLTLVSTTVTHTFSFRNALVFITLIKSLVKSVQQSEFRTLTQPEILAVDLLRTVFKFIQWI